jgi:S1-C subfamily serine protease
MEQKETKRHWKWWWVALGILLILLGTCLGALAGGAAGFVIGRRGATRVQQRIEQILPRMWRDSPQVQPQTPMQPGLPGGRRMRPWATAQGALVSEVTAGSPAEAAGIRAGDIITAIDGTQVTAVNAPQALIGKHRPGDTAKITIQTNGTERTLNVKLGTHPDQEGVAFLGIKYVMAPGVEDSPAD